MWKLIWKPGNNFSSSWPSTRCVASIATTVRCIASPCIWHKSLTNLCRRNGKCHRSCVHGSVFCASAVACTGRLSRLLDRPPICCTTSGCRDHVHYDVVWPATAPGADQDDERDLARSCIRHADIIIIIIYYISNMAVRSIMNN